MEYAHYRTVRDAPKPAIRSFTLGRAGLSLAFCLEFERPVRSKWRPRCARKVGIIRKQGTAPQGFLNIF
jgi:hypothetical protein